MLGGHLSLSLKWWNPTNHKLTEAPQKGEDKERNGRTHVQEDKWIPTRPNQVRNIKFPTSCDENRFKWGKGDRRTS
jgi:hypothetical protein